MHKSEFFYFKKCKGLGAKYNVFCDTLDLRVLMKMKKHNIMILLLRSP